MELMGERASGSTKDSRKHAVILSGGGAKGAYEIGVMKALFPGYSKCVSNGKEIHPVVYTGTSVGSYNAAYLTSRFGQAAKTALSELEGIWRERIASSYSRPNGVLRFRANLLEALDLDRLFADPLAPVRNFFQDGAFFAKDAIERTELFFSSHDRLTDRVIQLVDFSAFVSTDKLRDLIRETINLGALRRNQDQALVVAATNWESGEVKLFGNAVASDNWDKGKPGDGRQGRDTSKGDLDRLAELDDKIGHLALLASTAIPGVFPPVEIYHTKFVDGGLLLNTPLSPAIRALRAIAPGKDGYVVHAIYLDPDLKDVSLNRANNTMDTLDRFTALSFASQVNRDIKKALQINQSLEVVREWEDKFGVAGPAEERFIKALDRAKLIQGEFSPEIASKVFSAVQDVLTSVREPFKNLVEAWHVPLTIHRYHPRTTLGGIFGLLAFDSDYIARLIDLGFQDAVSHDCDESGCIFPTFREAQAGKRVAKAEDRRSDGRAPEMIMK